MALSSGQRWRRVSGSVYHRLDREWANAQLRRHEPHQAPGERFFQRLAVKVQLLQGMERDHPASVIDIPGAIPLPRSNGFAQRILQGATLECGIDAGLGDGAASPSMVEEQPQAHREAVQTPLWQSLGRLQLTPETPGRQRYPTQLNW
jgi:hypothetical protein